jgi:hypothetical protein
MDIEVKFKLSFEEKKICLKEIKTKLTRILHVYDQSKENPNYNYKIFVKSVLLFVSSSNYLFNGELVSILVNLNSIFINDLPKEDLKKIVLESRNYLDFLLKEGDLNGKSC